MAVDDVMADRRRLGCARGLKRLWARANNKSRIRASTRSPPPPRPPPRPDPAALASAALAKREEEVRVGPGLTEEEMSRIEARLAFTFPPDLRATLSRALPTSPGFPDWRSGSPSLLQASLDLPILAISYQVSHGRFWLSRWGPPPCHTDRAVGIALQQSLRSAPTLVPLFRHCYIPSSPCLPGNPVFLLSRGHVSLCAPHIGAFFENADFSASHMCCFRSLSDLGRPSSANSSSYSNRLKLALPRGEECDCSSDHGRDQDLSISSSFDETSFGEYSDESDAAPALRKATVKARDPPVKGIDPIAPCRRIELWSDLADRNGYMCKDEINQMQVHDDDGDHGSECKDQLWNPWPATPHWLDRYFDQMAMALRKEGWKEQDLVDMFLVVSSTRECPDKTFGPMLLSGHSCFPDRPSKEPMFLTTAHTPNKIFAMGGLVLYVDVLSNILRNAGWSSTEVSEAFDVDMSSNSFL